MQDALFNRASKSFDKYLKDFLENGIERGLPRGRLTTAEWDELNKVLVKYGVRMVSYKRNGAPYMKFSRLSRSKPVPSYGEIYLGLGEKLKKYTGLDWEHKTAQNSGLGYEHYRIKIDGLSEASVRRILDMLDRNAIFDANAVYTNKGQFLIVKAPDIALDSVLDYYTMVRFNGVPAYVFNKEGLSRAAAESRVEQIMKNGEHYAAVLNKQGHSGSDYIVIAMRKSDAQQIGCSYEDGVLSLPLDNSAARQRLAQNIGKPLTYINGVPAIIESKSDFGMYHGRPIVLVTVGKKKMPFYVSSGSAGKTDVLTGKWEFFGGITSGSWFRKGTLKEILAHYNSPELQQVAEALDKNIGDLRDTTDVLKTIGRQYLGGKGSVAKMMHGPEISRERVNQSVFNPDNDGVFPLDLRDIKQYLKNIRAARSVAQEFDEGKSRIGTKFFSKLSSLFKDDKNAKR